MYDRFPTIVTAFYDIRKLENETHDDNRKMSDYLSISEKFILTLPYPLVIFIEPDDTELFEFITEKRKNNIHKTHIRKEFLKDTYFYKYLDRISELQNVYHIYNGHLHHETPLYIIINNNKFHFIDLAIEENPFQSSHFIWMDFGINHVAETTNHIHDWIVSIPDKIRQLCINPYVEPIENDKTTFHNIYHHIAGGLFSGNIEYLQKYSQAFKDKTLQIYNENWWQVDEAVMTIICRENPDWFDLFYGDYVGIISNYFIPVHSIYLIFTGLNKCVDHNNTRFAQNILDYLTPFFEKEENQHGEFMNIYIRQSIIVNYYMNNRMLKSEVIRLINKQVIKNNQEVIQLLHYNHSNIQFYNNRHLIVYN